MTEEDILYENMNMDQRRNMTIANTLTADERQTIHNALRIAAEAFEKDAAGFHAIAKEIGEGKEVAGWARGKGGVIGAERLAEQFERQRDDARGLMELFE